MIYDFKGFNENVITLPAAEGLAAGNPVTIASGDASPANANSDFVGICTGVADGVATVQVSGYVEIAATGVSSYGYAGIVSNGSGGVKKSDSAVRKAYIIKIDSTNNKIGFIL